MGNQKNIGVLEYPLVRIFLILIIFLLIAKYFTLHFFPSIIITFSFLIMAFAFASSNKVLAEVLLYASIATLVLYYGGSSHSNYHYPFTEKKIKSVLVSGVVDDLNLSSNNKILLTNVEFKNASVKLPPRHKIMFYPDSNSINKVFGYGDTLTFVANIREPKGIRNPGEYDYKKYLSSKNIVLQAFQKEGTKLEVLPNLGFSISQNIYSFRKSIYRIIRKHSMNYSIITALLLGERDELDNETKSVFLDSGVYHVLSVSGLHVGFVLLLAYLIFARFGYYTKNIAGIIFLIIFLIIADFRIPVTRAVIMGVVFILAKLLEREYYGINALSLSGIIILLINPNDLFSSGYQLSFTAVLGLLLVYPEIKSRTDKFTSYSFIRWIINVLTITLVIQICVLPLQLFYFGNLNPFLLINNLIVLAILPFVLLASFVGIAASASINLFASLFFASADYILNIQETILKYLLSGASIIAFPKFTLVYLVAYYLLLASYFVLVKYFKTIVAKSTLSILVIIVLIIFVLQPANKYFEENKLYVVSIDVGQGDAFYIQFPNGKTALIDAGNRNKLLDYGKYTILPMLKYWGINKLDYAFVSHLDSDHSGGFYSIVNNIAIDTLYKPELSRYNIQDIQFETFMRSENIPINYFNKGIIEIGNARIYVLNHKFEYYTDENARSGILKLVYGNTSVLFTGDADVAIENYYVDEYGDFLNSDILKVGHHGSKNSSSERFLGACKPKYAIISSGKYNRFGHPDSSVLVQIEEIGAKFFNTATDSCIIFVSNGEKFHKFSWQSIDYLD